MPCREHNEIKLEWKKLKKLKEKELDLETRNKVENYLQAISWVLQNPWFRQPSPSETLGKLK